MRITVILLALAAGAVALPVPVGQSTEKAHLAQGLSQSFSFSLLFCSTRR